MLYVFADESGADGKNRFLIHGALLVRHPAAKPLALRLAAICTEHAFEQEMKWTRLNRASLARDLAAVDAFMDTYETDGQLSQACFQALSVDQHRVSVTRFHEGDKDLCFYKFLYPLLRNRICEFAQPGEVVHIRLDQRNTRRYDLRELRSVLQNGVNQKCRGSFGREPPMVLSVEYVDSKKSRLIQLADLLSGALGFHLNGHHLKPCASPWKLAAGQQVAKKLGVESLLLKERRHRKFGLWPLRLR